METIVVVELRDSSECPPRLYDVGNNYSAMELFQVLRGYDLKEKEVILELKEVPLGEYMKSVTSANPHSQYIGKFI